jgi:ElaB/YqjD/DUF883 family membrane-anchored ribosome-binding protein
MQADTNYSSTRPGAGGQSDTNAVGNPGGSIQSAMDASRNRISSAYQTMQQRSSDALQGAQGYIQERPFQAIIYAASVGAVIGLVAGMLIAGGSSSDDTDGSWRRRFW